MTKITFVKNKANEIIEFTANGHTNYGVEGEDIVCAGVSSIIQTASLGIFMVANVNAIIEKDDKKAIFSLKLPNNMTPSQKYDCAIILNTMFAGLKDLNEQYSDFIEIEG